MLADIIIVLCLIAAFGGLWAIGYVCGDREHDAVDDAIDRYLKERRKR